MSSQPDLLEVSDGVLPTYQDGSDSGVGCSAAATADEDNQKVVFLGGLSWQADEKDLLKLGEIYGEVEHVRVVRDAQTQKSKGFGFIKFTEDSAAQSLKSAKVAYVRNRKCELGDAKRGIGKVFNGLSKKLPRTMSTAPPMDLTRITEAYRMAKEMKMPILVMPESNISPLEHALSDTTVYVGGLSNKGNEEKLKTAFEKYGPVDSVSLIKDQAGNQRGFGFVYFKDAETAQRVKKLGFVDVGLPRPVKVGNAVSRGYRTHPERLQESPSSPTANGTAKNKISKTICKPDLAELPYGGVIYPSQHHPIIGDPIALAKAANAGQGALKPSVSMAHETAASNGDISSNGNTDTPQYTCEHHINMKIPHQMVPDLLGKRGKNLKDVCNKSGAQVTVTLPAGDGKETKQRNLQIVGLHDQVMKAQEMLLELLHQHGKTPKPDAD